MKTTVDAVFTDIFGGGLSRDGQIVQFNFALEGGKEFAVQMPVDVAARLLHGLTNELGKAHSARIKSDPTYRGPGYVESTTAKPIKEFEFGYDPDNNAVVLGARHTDGTITHLPIGQNAVAGVIEALRTASDAIKSGVKPRRQ